MRPDDESAQRHGPLRQIAQRLAGGGASAFVGAFNHLLRQNDWARARLAMFAGRRVSIGLESASLSRLAPPRLTARITGEGLLDTSKETAAAAPGEDHVQAAADAPRFDVEMHVRPSFAAAGALLREGTRGLAPYVRIEGEVMLAAALAEVAERMRWDPEEDLSRITGDVVAHRIGRGVGAARDAMREFRTRFAGSVGRRFADASGTLVAREELESLRTTIDALEARVSACEAKRRRRRAQAGARGGDEGSAEVDRTLPPQLLPPLALPKLDVDTGEAPPRAAAPGDDEAPADKLPGAAPRTGSGTTGSALP